MHDPERIEISTAPATRQPSLEPVVHGTLWKGSSAVSFLQKISGDAHADCIQQEEQYEKRVESVSNILNNRFLIISRAFQQQRPGRICLLIEKFR